MILFIYDIIQTSCFSVRSSKELADAFRRPSMLIESVENVNLQQLGYTTRLLVRFKTLGHFAGSKICLVLRWVN